MIAISTVTPTATIEKLQEQLERQLAAIKVIGEAERSAFAAVSAALIAYKEANLSPDYFESFAAKLLAFFPSEIHREYDELDAGDRVAELESRIAELDADIDGLMAANKELKAKNAELEIDNTAARAAHAQIEKVLLSDPVKQKVEELEADLFSAQTRANELHKMNDRLFCENEELKRSAKQNSLPADEGKFKVGDRVQVSPDSLTVSAGITGVIVGWFNDDAHPEQQYSMAKIRWDEPFVHNGVKSPDEGYFSLSELRLVTEEPPAKPESTELKHITTEIAYLKLTANDQVLSGYIGFKNGTDANGKKLSNAKVRAKKWMDHIQGLYGVSSDAIELRAAERLKGFDYEVKISQAKHKGPIISILNPLSRCNFSINPHDEPPQESPADTPSLEFQPVEPFDDKAPQYNVRHSGVELGKVFMSYSSKKWKISGDKESEFLSEELAAEELVKRSILPQSDDDAVF